MKVSSFSSTAKAIVQGLCAWALFFAAAGAATESLAKCQFERPTGWKGVLQWEGPCPSGSASGLGVLRAYEKGSPVLVFFGQMDRGNLVVGVIEQPGGFFAGRFEKGSPLVSDNRNEWVEAFRIGSQAASAAAASFRSNGNEASAQYYARKAEQLAAQLD